MEPKDRSGRRENSPKGSPAYSLKRKLVREGVPAAKPKGGFSGKAKDAARESLRRRKSGIGLPPLQRVKRAPGEVNPRKGKSGGLNRGGKMIE
jgi:hypothetical protein